MIHHHPAPELLFDYLSVRLDGPKAAGKKIGLNIEFTDLHTQYGLAVENAVLFEQAQASAAQLKALSRRLVEGDAAVGRTEIARDGGADRRAHEVRSISAPAPWKSRAPNGCA